MLSVDLESKLIEFEKKINLIYNTINPKKKLTLILKNILKQYYFNIVFLKNKFT